jgi:hypothetical protein
VSARRVPCFLACLVCAFSFRALTQDTGSVQGRILSQLTEVPLRGLKVYLVAAAGPDFQRRTASREHGGFEFRSIPAGRYVVVEESELTPYLKWREQSDIDVSARTVEVRPGQVSPPILIYLPVGAIIQGRVTSTDGQPIAGMQVTASRRMTVNGLLYDMPAGQAPTWQDGTYQIVYVRPGDCSLAADIGRQRSTQDGTETGTLPQNSRGDHLVRTFYPGVLNANSARPITVASNQVISDVNIQMQPGSMYSIRGFIRNASEGHSYKIHVQQGLDVSGARMIKVREDRSFSIAGLMPGAYGLELMDTTPSVHWRPSVLAYARVQVQASDVQDVQLTIKPPPTVVARVTVPGQADADPIRLFLRPTINPTAPIVFSDRDADGTYTFRTPSPEPNLLTVMGMPPGMSIQRIAFNGKPVSNAVIDLSNGGGEIDIAIGAGKAGPEPGSPN